MRLLLRVVFLLLLDPISGPTAPSPPAALPERGRPADTVSALDSLGRLARSDPAVRARLAELLRSPDSTAAIAAHWLGRAGAPGAALLTDALRDPRPRTRRLAAYGLGERGRPTRRARAELIRLLSDPSDSVAGMADWALTRGGAGAGPPLARLLRSLRFGATDVRVEPSSRCDAWDRWP